MNWRYVHALSVGYSLMLVWRGAVTPVWTTVRSTTPRPTTCAHLNGTINPGKDSAPTDSQYRPNFDAHGAKLCSLSERIIDITNRQIKTVKKQMAVNTA